MNAWCSIRRLPPHAAVTLASGPKEVSLALPANIAMRKNLVEILGDMLRSLTCFVTFHICGGRFSGHNICRNEFDEVAQGMGDCRFVYVLEGSRGRIEPIAVFIANDSLGHAQLYHLIDGQPPASNGGFQRSPTAR